MHPPPRKHKDEEGNTNQSGDDAYGYFYVRTQLFGAHRGGKQYERSGAGAAREKPAVVFAPQAPGNVGGNQADKAYDSYHSNRGSGQHADPQQCPTPYPTRVHTQAGGAFFTEA